MKYTKKNLIKLLEDNNITTTATRVIDLMLLALDNDILKREEIKQENDSESIEKKARGRPRKYPAKEVDPDKVVDPKYHRLKTIRTNPTTIKLTNVDTGKATTYGSLYKASHDTKHGCGYFVRNDNKVIDGILIEVMK
jgi:hypothetical protein